MCEGRLTPMMKFGWVSSLRGYHSCRGIFDEVSYELSLSEPIVSDEASVKPLFLYFLVGFLFLRLFVFCAGVIVYG